MTAKKMTPSPTLARVSRNAHILDNKETQELRARVAADLPIWREENFRRAASRMRAAKVAAYRGPVKHPVRIGDIP